MNTKRTQFKVIHAIALCGSKVGQSTFKKREIPWNSKGFRISYDYSHSINP